MALISGGKSMNREQSYILVATEVLPEVYLKVVEAKQLMKNGLCETAIEAAAKVGISRSAFYKYKNHVFPVDELSSDYFVSVFFMLQDKPGVLSGVLDTLSDGGTNILTVNSSIPVNNTAGVTITFRTENMSLELGELLEQLRHLKGVNSLTVMTGE